MSANSESFINYLEIVDQEDNGLKAKLRYMERCPLDHNSNSKAKTQREEIPLIILGGTGQSISTFAPHIMKLSKYRRLIIPELRCQGMFTQLDSKKATMPQHVLDLKNILQALDVRQCDLCGFSFGGRVAVAFAAHHPSMVNRLSMTCVPLVRNNLGKAIINSWAAGLGDGKLRDIAWSFIINGYSGHFVEHNFHRIETYIDYIIESNDQEKLHDLMRLSHARDDSDEYGVKYSSSLIRCPTQVIGASEDRISSIASVLDLHRAIPHSGFLAMDTGHLAPFEKPNEWMRHVLDFMPSTL